MRTTFGFNAFQSTGKAVSDFLAYTETWISASGLGVWNHPFRTAPVLVQSTKKVKKTLGTNKMRGNSKLFSEFQVVRFIPKAVEIPIRVSNLLFEFRGHPEELIFFKLLTLGSILGTLDPPVVFFFSPRFKPGRKMVKKKSWRG